MGQDDGAPMRVRWARLRLQIIGTLLASPPPDGELAARIAELAVRTWKHATTGGVVQYSAKTIERWYYAARGEQDPFRALERRVPKHAGTHPAIGDALAEVIRNQHRDHPRWSYQLHYDNVLALAREDPRVGIVPSYVTVRRFMKTDGLLRSAHRAWMPASAA